MSIVARVCRVLEFVILSVCMRQVTFCVHVVGRVLSNLETEGHSTKEIVRDQLNESHCITHEKLVTSPW